MVRTGIYYAAALVAGGLALSWLTRPAWAWPLYLAAAFCLYFFRDPERVIPEGPVAVAPADGRIVAVAAQPDGATRLSIFLSVFDVHVNRAPIGGTIASVEYRPGRFHIASREEASVENEQNTVTLEGDGSRVVFKQIAGIVARRIIFYKRAGDRVEKGERVGLIQFGSRLDLVLGPEWEILVRRGDRVRAGSSIVARRKNS
jgi:phosphatidylserine decarboxylase